MRNRSGLYIAATLSLALMATTGHAAQGDCGQPATSGSNPTATDCLYILKTAVGAQTCSPTCICDVNAAGGVTATDALTCLKKAVGQDVLLNCPCTESEIGPNDTVNGEISPDDKEIFDGSFADLYTLTIPTSGHLTVRMSSNQVDSYLALFTDACLDEPDLANWGPCYITEDDDGGGGMNAYISVVLAAGRYVILANTFGASDFGSYTLTTTFEPGAAVTGEATSGIGRAKGGAWQKQPKAQE